MTKDIYKWWTRKALKGEILKLKLTYNELFDNMLKTQQENKELKKAYNICNEANIDLREKIKTLRKTLNERSYTALEEELTKTKEIIRELVHEISVFYIATDRIVVSPTVKQAEQLLKEMEK